MECKKVNKIDRNCLKFYIVNNKCVLINYLDYRMIKVFKMFGLWKGEFDMCVNVVC